MEYPIIFCVFAILLLVGSAFFLEGYVVSKLPEDNKFKKWWRSNVIGIYEGDDY
jgi:hypothetical protein